MESCLHFKLSGYKRIQFKKKKKDPEAYDAAQEKKFAMCLVIQQALDLHITMHLKHQHQPLLI